MWTDLPLVFPTNQFKSELLSPSPRYISFLFFLFRFELSLLFPSRPTLPAAPRCQSPSQ